MPESFGARLRRQRERQQITLASIAEQTKIQQSLLEELERDAVSHWPSGIFRRAFIRAYAHAIGLQPDAIVTEFLALYPDPAEVVTIESALGGDAGNGRRPPTRLKYVAGTAKDSLARSWRGLFQKSSAPVDDRPSGGETAPPPVVDFDLLAAAHLCTELARADAGTDVTQLLGEAVRILDAVGLIVWVWDAEADELKAALAGGYSESVLSQLPKVKREADNATAAAFRSAQTCAVHGGERSTGALAVPVMSPDGCVGVLAVELPPGDDHVVALRAVVTMFAAQLGRLIAAAPAAESAERRRA
jgi:transcriptional regulator with XRE-family HTH domain